jgi:hypothetical protein
VCGTGLLEDSLIDVWEFNRDVAPGLAVRCALGHLGLPDMKVLVTSSTGDTIMVEVREGGPDRPDVARVRRTPGGCSRWRSSSGRTGCCYGRIRTHHRLVYRVGTSSGQQGQPMCRVVRRTNRAGPRARARRHGARGREARRSGGTAPAAALSRVGSGGFSPTTMHEICSPVRVATVGKPLDVRGHPTNDGACDSTVPGHAVGTPRSR